MFDSLGGVGPLGDVSTFLACGFDISTMDFRIRKQVSFGMNLRAAAFQCCFGIGHRSEHLVIYIDFLNRFPCIFLGIRDDNCQHIADVSGFLSDFDHQRPILNNQPGMPGTGNVFCREDPFHAWMSACFREVHGKDFGPGMITEFERPIKHPFQFHVSNIRSMTRCQSS